MCQIVIFISSSVFNRIGISIKRAARARQLNVEISNAFILLSNKVSDDRICWWNFI